MHLGFIQIPHVEHHPESSYIEQFPEILLIFG